MDIEPVLATRRTGKSRITLLHNASSNGHAAFAVGLLDRKADVNALNTHGKDPLMFAARNGSIPVMDLLISRGADVNTRDNERWTALVYAAGHGNLPACLLLISHKANLTEETSHLQTALSCYGRFASTRLSNKAREHCREVLRDAWAYGPHPLQCWKRRRKFMMFASAFNNQTGIAFMPLAYRRALNLIAYPSLPPNVPIPPVELATPELRRTKLHNCVFGSEALFKYIMKFL